MSITVSANGVLFAKGSCDVYVTLYKNKAIFLKHFVLLSIKKKYDGIVAHCRLRANKRQRGFSDTAARVM